MSASRSAARPAPECSSTVITRPSPPRRNRQPPPPPPPPPPASPDPGPPPPAPAEATRPEGLSCQVSPGHAAGAVGQARLGRREATTTSQRMTLQVLSLVARGTGA